MNASKECNRAPVQEEKEKKKWTDAESERWTVNAFAEPSQVSRRR
jgi:hypothetical protein